MNVLKVCVQFNLYIVVDINDSKFSKLSFKQSFMPRNDCVNSSVSLDFYKFYLRLKQLETDFHL